MDGAGREARSVFGIILGTGCGGGIVIERRLVEGARGIGGEWGHNPLPWQTRDEEPGAAMLVRAHGCLEVWISGPALAADHERTYGARLSAEQIAEQAEAGDAGATATLARHADRVARGLAHVINIVDPELIVIGGGAIKAHAPLCGAPAPLAPHVFSDAANFGHPAACKWGDAGGVRGAAVAVGLTRA